MSHELVTVANFATPSEAAAARAALEAEGIQTHLTNEAMLTWGWQFSNATGGAELQVPDEDEEKARAILAEAIEQKQQTGDEVATWSCLNCNATVDARMATCWSCGASSEGEVDTDFIETDPQAAASQVDRTGAPPSWFITTSTLVAVYIAIMIAFPHEPIPSWVAVLKMSLPLLLAGYTVITLLTPRTEIDEPDEHDDLEESSEEPTELQPHTTAQDSSELEEQETSPEMEQADHITRRAWIAAVYGICFVPLLMNAYSMWQIMRYTFLVMEPTLQHQQRIYGALIINALVMGSWAVIIGIAVQ